MGGAREFRVLEAKEGTCEEKGVSLCRLLLVVKEEGTAEGLTHA